VILLVMALFVSEKSLAAVDLSVSWCLSGAIALGVLCALCTMQAAIERRADDVTIE
jgi:hypothetical protein